MVQINFAKREINCKLVYYGPGLSGKTTNLEVVHKKAPASKKGELTSIATEGDRTLFFDYMPLELGKVGGMNTKFQLYTVPGQVYYNATRKLVLQGADGVVFVADSQADKMDENIESFQNLEDNLREQGLDPKTIPMVLQWNKRDLPNLADVEELDRGLNKYNCPTFEAVAVTGEGVFPTLKKLAQMVLEKLNKEYGLQSEGGKGGGSSSSSSSKPPSPPRPPAGGGGGGPAVDRAPPPRSKPPRSRPKPPTPPAREEREEPAAPPPDRAEALPSRKDPPQRGFHVKGAPSGPAAATPEKKKGGKVLMVTLLLVVVLAGGFAGGGWARKLPPAAQDLYDQHVSQYVGYQTPTDDTGGADEPGDQPDGDGAAKDDGDGAAKDDGDGAAKDDGDGAAKDDGDGAAKDDGDGAAKDDGAAGDGGGAEATDGGSGAEDAGTEQPPSDDEELPPLGGN